ncbi:hypothetical protein EDB92DRAFT_1945188 [Lactarius akahatsu]|uniref:Uncharacterized protein n=1 Tax=Lactarius akahatsu TaxID=416441 RepID=A0AAD4LI10_9AGAM|nr:hypothetical protein EDB92DRAFT_1945188 [Lactarius akahatsu]
MSNEFLRSPRPQYEPTNNQDNMLRLNRHQPGANYASSYHGHWPPYHDTQYRGNLWYGSLPPPADLEGQRTYQGNPNVGYPAPGCSQYMHVPDGPPRGECYIPPIHDLANDGVRDRPPPMTDMADPFSMNVPNYDPPRTSATEDLKRLASRYLQNPDSRLDAFRMGPSPSGGRLRMMIVLDIDI